MGDAPLVFDLPVLRDGLTHGGTVQFAVIAFLAAGALCTAVCFQAVRHSLKLPKDSE